MNQLNRLIQEVESARQAFIHTVDNVSGQQAEFKPDENIWSLRDITEHIVWAEKIGVMGMWKAAEALKDGHPLWEGENPNEGLSIEEVVERTWQSKEKVPEVAKPHWGGPIEFWLTSLDACTPVLRALENQLSGMNTHRIIYPHPISGPLNVTQRLAFLRFHLQRHQKQMETLMNSEGFPAS